MRYAQAYCHGGEWKAEDFHEDAQRRFNAMATRAVRGSRIEADEWSRIAGDLRRVAALPEQCPIRADTALKSAVNADFYGCRGVPGGSDPRYSWRQGDS